MEKEEIFDSAVALPEEDRKELIGVLVESVRPKEEVVDVDGIVRVAGAIVGIDPNTPWRTRQATIARAIASYRLRLCNMTYSGIGRVFHKNYSTIIHYCKMIEDALEMPRAFRDIAYYWQQMLEVYPL